MVSRHQQDLTALKKALANQGKDTSEVEASLQATREAIRQNWENLEWAMFALHDLTGIDLYKAKAHGAYFGGAILQSANLCGADLSSGNFEYANLSFADLRGANLRGSSGWSEDVNLEGANIRDVQNAPPEFDKATHDRVGRDGRIYGNALDLPFIEWQRRLRAEGHLPPPHAVWTDCADPEPRPH